jgi:predicted nucleic acid-binding protein
MPENISGLDTNILCYALDPAFSEHEKASLIMKRVSIRSKIATNATVIHETYHTLVYKQKWTRQEAGSRILSFMSLKNVAFFNQTKSIVRNGIYLANKYELGGRDSLILANYMFNGVTKMYTHDQRLVDLGKISDKDRELNFTDPVV